MKYGEFGEFITLLAQESARQIKPHFASLTLEVEEKQDGSPVTLADRNSEEVMRNLIKKRYPNHGIIGEEFGSEKADAEYVWVLDPIDGTLAFTSGSPHFGTLIGLLYQGKPILGAINQPILDLFCIGDGSETRLNGKRVQMREKESLSSASLLTTSIDGIERIGQLKEFEKLRKKAKVFRTWGDCYGYLMMAAGWADVMLDPIVNPWDILPIIPIIEGAGGKLSSWFGESLLVDHRSCIAASPKIHQEIMAIISKNKR